MEEVWVIIALGHLLQANPAQGRPSYTFTTLPVPHVRGREQFLVVSVWSSSAPVMGRPRIIFAPARTGYVRFPDMTIHWQDALANDIGVSTKKNEFGQDVVGVLDRSHVKTATEWLDYERRYHELLSIVLTKKWLLEGYSSPAEEQKVAQRLKECLAIIEDDVMKQYYRVVGWEFFQWIDRNTR